MSREQQSSPKITRHSNAIVIEHERLSTIFWSSGQLYVGEVNNQSQPEGIGLLLFPFCGFYFGKFVQGLAVGRGLLRLPNGDSYSSEFREGLMDGWTFKSKGDKESVSFYSKGFKLNFPIL